MEAMLGWKNILVATDFSPAGEAALRSAAAIAEQGGGSLTVLHVTEQPPMFSQPLLDRIGPADPNELWTREARRSIADIMTKLRGDLKGVRGCVRIGTPSREIIRLADELDADAIVLGSKGTSTIQRLLLGSTAEDVVRNATCPVLVVRDEPLERIRRVLLPVDMDDGSRATVRYALEHLGEGVEIEAVHVVGFPRHIDPELAGVLPDDAESAIRLRAFLDDLGAERIPSRVVLGEPAAAILDAAAEVDLVLIATRGLKGIARALLGSVAGKVVRLSERPVLVVPPSREGTLEAKPGTVLEGEVHPSGRSSGAQ
jgi:nucleotide-binding universal stress UspA family protein